MVSGPAATFLSLSVCGCVVSVQTPLSVSPSVSAMWSIVIYRNNNESDVDLDKNFDICIDRVVGLNTI